MTTNDDDKRGNDRLTINKEFESFDAFIQEYVTNISRTGVFIKSTAPLKVGTSGSPSTRNSSRSTRSSRST